MRSVALDVRSCRLFTSSGGAVKPKRPYRARAGVLCTCTWASTSEAPARLGVRMDGDEKGGMHGELPLLSTPGPGFAADERSTHAP